MVKRAEDLKIAILGMGYLAGYVRPCYETLLGPRMEEQMIAVKGTDKGLREKQAKFPFPILVADNRGALERLKPDLILIATKPNQVSDVVCTALKPYYESLRGQGEPLPDIYSFAPNPPVTFFADVLGSDVFACNILPNMVDQIQGLHVADLTHSFITFDDRYPCPEEKRDFVCRFLNPIGRVLEVTKGEAVPLLAAKIACHSMYEIHFALDDVLAERGMPYGLTQTAGAMRAFHRSRFDLFQPDIYHCSMDEVEPEVLPFIKACCRSWYDGIVACCDDNGIRSDVSRTFLSGITELHLLTVQMESREALLYNNSVHATKGGVLEKGITTFYATCYEPLKEAFRTHLDGRLLPEFWDRLEKLAYKLTCDVYEHGQGLSK